MNREKWHTCPRTTPKYKSSAEHLSCLCIWSFLPLSSIQLTTGCWKVLSAISLSVITTVALCSDPGFIWRARGHVPFHNAASSPSSGARCAFVKDDVFQLSSFFFFFREQWATGKVEQKKRAGDIWQRLSAKFCQIRSAPSASELTSGKLNLSTWHLSWWCCRDISRSCSWFLVLSYLLFLEVCLLVDSFWDLNCCPCYAVFASLPQTGMTSHSFANGWMMTN